MTCFSSIKDDVINAGAEYLDQEVVRDRNLITSRGPRISAPFAARSSRRWPNGANKGANQILHIKG